MKELGSLFGDTIYSWQESEDWTEQEKFYMEQELLGIGVSKHPLQTIASKAYLPDYPNWGFVRKIATLLFWLKFRR